MQPTQRPASGRFVLRIPPGLHAALREAAADADLSLNAFCGRKLMMPAGNGTALEPATAIIARAAEQFGAGLIGIVAYGSWSRGEATARSDVDVLVVLAREIRITRGLYRRWDTSPLTWDDYPVEPHFVHLPASAARISGLWAETAVDGIVLFERGLRISRHLVRVRRAICDGRLVRRFVHGQPYWAEAS